MAENTAAPDGFEEQLAEANDLLNRVAGLVEVNRVCLDALKAIAGDGDDGSRYVAADALRRADTIRQERM